MRNSAPSGAAAVVVTLGAAVSDAPPVCTEGLELLVPWITDEALRETAAVVIAANVRVDPELVADAKNVELVAAVRWLGGETAPGAIAIPLRRGGGPLTTRFEIPGLGGDPVDLNDAATLEASAQSVRDCFSRLRDRLRQGQPVRAVIYGRRRRGKEARS